MTHPARCAGVLAEREPPRVWADLRQDAFYRLKEEDAALLRSLSTFEASSLHNVPPATDAMVVAALAGSSTSTELVQRASWVAVCQEKKTQLEDELHQKEKRMLRCSQPRPPSSVRRSRQYPDQGRIFTITRRCGSRRRTTSAPRDAAKEGGGSGGNSGAARIQLVAQGEGGPQELPQLMRNWVDIEQSIPCFLVSVTLECYDKWNREREMSGLRE